MIAVLLVEFTPSLVVIFSPFDYSENGEISRLQNSSQVGLVSYTEWVNPWVNFRPGRGIKKRAAICQPVRFFDFVYYPCAFSPQAIR
jgi:hypothetical protein